MTITPKTKLFAVLGHPIKHSLSPLMHNAAIQAMRMDAVYLAFDVLPERLMHTLSIMSELGFLGINLTIPLKEVAFRGISNLDESAKILGSVNTVKVSSGNLYGYSTDGIGFLHALKQDFDLSIKGLTVFVLGCGGAGRAVAITCAMAHVDRLLLGNRNILKAQKVQAEIKSLHCTTTVEIVPSTKSSWTEASLASDLVVHATSRGMNGSSDPLLDVHAFHQGQYVYDLIYMFPETGLMRVARKNGAQVANGLSMLLFQGALSFTIWTGSKLPVKVMRQVLEKAVYK